MSEHSKRSRSGASVSGALAAGRLELQRCAACAAVQYPPAEICRRCLGGDLGLAPFDARGIVIATVRVHRSYREDFEHGGPWAVASVKLDAGPVVFAHAAEVFERGAPVLLVALIDRLGDGVFGAVRRIEQQSELQARFTGT